MPSSLRPEDAGRIAADFAHIHSRIDNVERKITKLGNANGELKDEIKGLRASVDHATKAVLDGADFDRKQQLSLTDIATDAREAKVRTALMGGGAGVVGGAVGSKVVEWLQKVTGL